ncbi:unnamed protein product [Spirodela intermedia]|uniref:Uncharacterized protein n=1 Tax=Spirodela intermedia TaxID=51605 RepID=A0A7I8IRJ6_SPIIN|nr:unnamed protein product [Spirodela intermedia]CAA6659581.1 unnamed protein product [Spirodela intermedia]
MAVAVVSVVLLLPILLVSALHEPDSASLSLVIPLLGGGLSAQLRSSVSGGGVSLTTCRLPGVACARKRRGVLRAVSLSLPFHGLDGSLSPAIGRLSGLRELSLPGNLLSGEIPPEIAGCTRLQVLNLSGNTLSGQVPFEISSLSGLRALDISENKISGSVDFLASLRNLERLSLGGNLFTGRIPPVLSSLRKLRFLHLTGNPGLRGPLLKLPAGEKAYSSGEPLSDRYKSEENSSRDDDRADAAATDLSPSPSASPPAKITPWQFVREYIISPLVMSIYQGIAVVIYHCLVDCWCGKRDNQEDPETELGEEHSVKQEGTPAEEPMKGADKHRSAIDDPIQSLDNNEDVCCVSVQIA